MRTHALARTVTEENEMNMLTQFQFDTIQRLIKDLEARAAALPKSRRRPINQQITVLEDVLVLHAMQCLWAHAEAA
jgi:hypothetical protein